MFCSLSQENVIECASVKKKFGMLCTRIEIVYLVFTACPPGYFGELCNMSCPLGSFGEKCGGICSPKCIDEYCDPVEGCLFNNRNTAQRKMPSMREIVDFKSKNDIYQKTMT